MGAGRRGARERPNGGARERGRRRAAAPAHPGSRALSRSGRHLASCATESPRWAVGADLDSQLAAIVHCCRSIGLYGKSPRSPPADCAPRAAARRGAHNSRAARNRLQAHSPACSSHSGARHTMAIQLPLPLFAHFSRHLLCALLRRTRAESVCFLLKLASRAQWLLLDFCPREPIFGHLGSTGHAAHFLFLLRPLTRAVAASKRTPLGLPWSRSGRREPGSKTSSLIATNDRKLLRRAHFNFLHLFRLALSVEPTLGLWDQVRRRNEKGKLELVAVAVGCVL